MWMTSTCLVPNDLASVSPYHQTNSSTQNMNTKRIAIGSLISCTVFYSIWWIDVVSPSPSSITRASPQPSSSYQPYHESLLPQQHQRLLHSTINPSTYQPYFSTAGKCTNDDILLFLPHPIGRHGHASRLSRRSCSRC